MLPTFDRSQSIVNSLHDVQFTLYDRVRRSSCLVIFVFLGRASDTLIPMVALPMSLPDHVRGDVVARLLDQQPHPHGAHPRHRLPRR